MPSIGLNPLAKFGLTPVDKPICLSEMKDICRKLSGNLIFSRIDFYVIDGKEYFGEITFYPASGFGKFTPAEWDLKLGKLINLNIYQSRGIEKT